MTAAAATFRLTVAYDGTAYAGWQVQPDVPTVQGKLEEAASALNGEFTRLLGAGRTDAGVHAEAQAVRFRSKRDIPATRVPSALNSRLPADIRVTSARAVPHDFHPIGDAQAKHYRYTWRVGAISSPFDRRYVMELPRRPDIGRMRAAARHLVGRHDFAGFQKSGSPRDTTVRTLHRLDVEEQGSYIRLQLVGDGFLYGMARNLAGCVLRAGQGRLDSDCIPAALAAVHGPEDGSTDSTVDRSIGGPCLPAHGLCLVRVVYNATEPSSSVRVSASRGITLKGEA